MDAPYQDGATAEETNKFRLVKLITDQEVQAITAVTDSDSPVTAAAAWDNGAVITLPEGTQKIHVGITEDCYLVPNASDSAPSTDGCRYKGGYVWPLPCRGCTRLHHKRAGASNATVTVTAIGE